MSSQVDGSVALGIVLDDSGISSQAQLIGEKIAKEVAKSLQKGNLFTDLPVNVKVPAGSAKSQGKVYGDEFISSFLGVLSSGNASLARQFQGTYDKVSKKEGEAAGDNFVKSFEGVLSKNGTKPANEFARGMSAAFDIGGAEAGKRFSNRFSEGLKSSSSKSADEFNREFLSVLGRSNPGTAKIFGSIYQEAAKTSTDAATVFSGNFQKILSANGPKFANEYANGFGLAFKAGGETAALNYTRAFESKMISNAAALKSSMKTVLESPAIPQGFVDTFSKILAKNGPTIAKQFSATWNQIYAQGGEASANEFQKKFESILKRKGNPAASEYAKGMSAAYSVAGEKAGQAFSKQFKGVTEKGSKDIAKMMKDILVSTIGNALSAGLTGVFNGILGTIKGFADKIAGGIQESIGKSLTFNKGIRNLEAISGSSREDAQRVGKDIRKVSLTTPVNNTDLTEIATEFSKAGVPIDAINQKLLRSNALLSQLSGESAGATAKVVNQIQSGFDLPMNDMVSTMELLTATANGSQSSVASLGQGFSNATATAKTLGVSVQDTALALGMLSNAGMDGGKGGVAFQNTLKGLADNAEMLSQLGVTVFDDKGLLDYQTALKQIDETIKGLSKEDQYKFLSEIFNERGARGAAGLISGLQDSNEKTKELRQNIQEMNGVLERSGAILQGDTATSIDILYNKIDELKTRFGDAFGPGIAALTEFGNQTADYLLNNSDLFDKLNQANEEFAAYMKLHPEYAKMLADIIGELANQLFQELLNATRSLLEYLKQNPKAVQDLVSRFKDFMADVGRVLPMVGKLVEMLFNGAKALGFIKDGAGNNPGQDDPNGKHYFKSGLYTGPESNNGGSSAYHIDNKFARDLPFDKVIAAMDSMAHAYEEQGRVIEFSNAAVGGQRYDVNDPNRGAQIKKAFDAHSHSVSADYNSLDYYIPKKEKDRFASGSDGGEGVEIMLPAFKGGKTEYATGGRYGNYALLSDDSGKVVMKSGHGDDRKPLPQTRNSYTGNEKSSNRDDSFSIEGSKVNNPQYVGEKKTPGTITDRLGSGSSGYDDHDHSDHSDDKKLGKTASKSSSRTPKPNSKVGLNSATPDQYVGAVVSILEAPSRQGRLDSAQVIANRTGGNFNNNGRSIREQVFARGQFAPTWGYGIDKNEIQDFPSAVKALKKKPGYTDELAKKELGEFFNDLNNPRMVKDSQSKVGGRQYFKGTSEQGSMVRGEDFLRNPNENFFHHEASDKTNRSMTPIGDVFGGGTSSGGSSGGLRTKIPEYQSLDQIMGSDALGEQSALGEMLNLEGGKSTKLDKLREKRDKEIEKAIKEQETQAKKEAGEVKKNETESLKVKRDINKDKRETEKRELTKELDKKSNTFANTPLAEAYGVSRAKTEMRFSFGTELKDAAIALEEIELKIKEIKDSRMEEKGIGKTLAMYQDQAKFMKTNISEIKKLQVEELANVGVQYEAKTAIDKRKQSEEEIIKVLERKAKFKEAGQKMLLGTVKDSDSRTVLENSFKLSDLGTDRLLKSLPITNSIDELTKQITVAEESGMDFGNSLEVMKAKLNSLKADLTSVTEEFKIAGSTIEAESNRILDAKILVSKEEAYTSSSNNLKGQGNSTLDDELNRIKALESEAKRYLETLDSIQTMRLAGASPLKLQELTYNNETTNKDNNETITGTKNGYDEKLYQTRLATLKGRGGGFKAAEVEQDRARTDEMVRYAQEMAKISEMPIPSEKMMQLAASAKEINNLNLENISRQFDTLGNTVAKVAQDDIGSFISASVKDFSKLGENFENMVDSMLAKLLEFAIQSALSGIFKGGGMGLFGGGGGKKEDSGMGAIGGLIGSLFGGGLPGFSNGGIVSGGGGSYTDSVMAMLAPGEAVLSADKVQQLSGIKPIDNRSGNQGAIASGVAPISVTTIVNIDGNGKREVTRDGADSLGSDLESAVVGIVTRMKYSPGGELNS